MMKFWKTGGLVLSLLMVFGTAITVSVKADNQWGNYHWARTANPFTLKLVNQLTSDWQSYLNVASGDWSLSSVLSTEIVAPPTGGGGPGGGRGGGRGKPQKDGGDTKNARKPSTKCDVVSGQIIVCNAAYGRTGWLGVAGIYASGDHITGSYVKLNDSYSMTNEEKALVTCQEIGHAFGLDHQDEAFNNPPLGTCMDYTSTATAGANQHPNAHDYETLEVMYAHLDTTTTVGALIDPEVANTDFGHPSSWGRAIRFSKDGKPVLFERDFGKGNKVFTHVFPITGHRYVK